MRPGCIPGSIYCFTFGSPNACTKSTCFQFETTQPEISQACRKLLILPACGKLSTSRDNRNRAVAGTGLSQAVDNRAEI
jgi:hypothetical protein